MGEHQKKTEWIHSFAITDVELHEKGFTVYKITSIVIPRNVPEALSCVTVLKRFKEVRQLYKDIQRKAREVKLKTVTMPELKSAYFTRFKPEVIEERKEFILNLMNWIGEHPALFRSETFVRFFNSDSEPEPSSTENLDLSVEVPDTSDALEVIASRFGAGEDPEVNQLFEKIKEEAKLDERLELEQNQAIEDRFRRLQEDSPIDYLYEAALKFTEAVEAESTGKYEAAFGFYKVGIDILLSGGKADTDPQRKKIVKEKVAKYLARAEDIYENFVLKQESDELLVLSGKTEQSFEHLTGNLERPLNYLSRFKVIKIVDGVQQIQDVTDKKIYMLKVIPKPPSIHASRLMYLPQDSKFMVPLITYCQSSDSIFLLLRLVGGGKLWSYIQNYSPDVRPSFDCKSIFVEPKPRKPIPLAISMPEFTREADDDEDDPPSVDMEIPDLLQCSQKLLSSISSTLERSKVDDSDIDEGSIDEILREIGSGDDNLELESILKEVQHELNEDLAEIGCKPEPLPCLVSHRSKLLPETTVINYCAELVVAVADLHAHEIICGDLNLDNVLLGPKGHLVLTYFYRNEIRLKAPSRQAMTEAYVAPERPLTRKSDWWSVGVIMYELLTERRFHQVHPGSVEHFAELQYPDEMEISDEAKDLLEHLVEPNEASRYEASMIFTHKFFTSIQWEEIKTKGQVQF